MPVPAVTRHHLERAWMEATGAKDVLEPGKLSQEIIREFMREVPKIAGVMVAASAKRFRRPERASLATWIGALLYRSFKMAGAKFAPIINEEIIDLLTAEHTHLVQVSKLPGSAMAEAEYERLAAMPNGHLMEIVMQLWARASGQISRQGEDPSLLVQDTYFARLHLAVVLAALNISAERGV